MSELRLIRLIPDRVALARWAAQIRQPPGVRDDGHLWHGLLKAAFGESAPKPFVDRLTLGSNEFLGYATDCVPRSDLEAPVALAVGLSTLEQRMLPTQWREGRILSFEVRVRPVVRSRQNGPQSAPVELDAAVAARRSAPEMTREEAYRAWLERELGREQGAQLLQMRLEAFARSRVLRRQGPEGQRRWGSIEGPDAWLRGSLRVVDGAGFARLLARGIGRHRSYGFGCLLVAPAGVLG